MNKKRGLCEECGKNFETEKEVYDYVQCPECGKNSYKSAYVETTDANKELIGETIKEIYDNEYYQIIVTESGKMIAVKFRPTSYESVGLQLLNTKKEK